MWGFYLALCEMAFRYDGLMVNQLLLAGSIDALPLTRNYMVRDETAIARRLTEQVVAPVSAGSLETVN